MCDWVDLIYSCKPGSEGFILGLLEFVEMDMTGIDVKFPDCCETLFGGCPSVTFCAPEGRFTVEQCSCDWDIFKVLCNPDGYMHLPEIECLRDRYFPAGMVVEYEIA